MGATIARQHGGIQLEQSEMQRVRNMAKLSKGRILRTAVNNILQEIKQSAAEI
jgi:hypothetical protein